MEGEGGGGGGSRPSIEQGVQANTKEIFALSYTLLVRALRIR